MYDPPATRHRAHRRATAQFNVTVITKFITIAVLLIHSWDWHCQRPNSGGVFCMHSCLPFLVLVLYSKAVRGCSRVRGFCMHSWTVHQRPSASGLSPSNG